MAALISIIIPALNEEHALPATLHALQQLGGSAAEVLVVDGGSTDRTVQIAESLGASVLLGIWGRGPQQHAGALATRGDVLWFLHADTLPQPGALASIAAALQDPAVIGGHFRLHFSGNSFAAKFVGGYQPVLRKLGLIYGDSAVFARRSAYLASGGFAAVPLFDDLDFTRRLRRQGRFVTLPDRVVTSSRRFEGRLFRTLLQWALLQLLYDLRVSPKRLAALYRHLR